MLHNLKNRKNFLRYQPQESNFLYSLHFGLRRRKYKISTQRKYENNKKNINEGLESNALFEKIIKNI